MKRRLQVLALCAAFMAARLMAQDTSGGGGGGMQGGGGGADAGGSTNAGGSTDTSGGGATQDNSGNSSSTTGQNGNGSTPSESPAPSGAGGQEDNGTGATMPTELPDAGGGQNENPGSTTVPQLPTTLFPGEITPSAAAVPAASASPSTTGSNPYGAASQAAQGAAAQQPVTFTVLGGYGNPGSQSFTLGQGRLAKPPITFTATVSEGYDTNIFSADSTIQPTPTPRPGATPPLESRIIGFRIAPPTISPIYQYFRARSAAAPTPSKPLGVIGSPVTTANVGVQIQHATPRSVFTMDLSIGEQLYANEPGNGTDYTGNFDLDIVHRLSPRATIDLEATAVYQNTPNFSLINAPTNNGNGGNYLNGNIKSDFTYAWGARLSTVTSAQVNFNVLETTQTSNLYQLTYGNQFRYTVSARNTVSAEIREQQTIYPDNATANNSALFYLLGLDTIVSRKISNTISGGFEVVTYPGGASQSLPYLETATTLALPHEGAISWTNQYGSQPSGNAGVNSVAYRTGLTLSQPLSTKLSASLSLSYNYVVSTDGNSSALNYNQNELQTSFGLALTVNPRFSLSLNYNYIDYLTSQINSSYVRQQIYLGGTYTFK